MSTFEDLLGRLGSERSSINDRSLYVGAPPLEAVRREPVTTLPETLDRVLFALEPTGEPYVQPELIRAFLESPFAETVRELFVGGSSYWSGSSSMDYSASVRALAGAHLPALRRAAFGEWALMHNAHCAYGTIGALDDVLPCVAHVEDLGVYGRFSLSTTVDFPNVTKLTVSSDDPNTGMHHGPIAAASFAHLLSGRFPRLTETEIHLLCEPEQTRHALPDCFLDGTNVPQLDFVWLISEDFDDAGLSRVVRSRLFARENIRAAVTFDGPFPPGLEGSVEDAKARGLIVGPGGNGMSVRTKGA